MKFRIGTRGSALALWQAQWVQQQLQRAGHEAELVTMETRGDQMLNVAIAKIGSKGVFTEELEQALRQEHVDLAVHSAKDLPSELDAAFTILAFTKRHQPHDVVLSMDPTFTLSTAAAGTVVGSSSTRRQAMLRRNFPHLTLVENRGNLQTRLQKLRNKEFDAMILALAGVERMGFSPYIVETLPLELSTPAVGQGALAIETLSNLDPDKAEVLYTLLNDAETEACIRYERAFLATLRGGCSVPIYGLAQSNGRGTLTLRAGILSLDGSQHLEVQHASTGRTLTQLALAGQEAAQLLIDQGALRILDQIKKGLA